MTHDAAIIAEIIAPIFALLGLGWGLGRINFFTQEAGKSLVRFVWYIGIPALLIRSIAARPLPNIEEFALVGAYYLSLMLIYCSVYFGISKAFHLPAAERAVMALSACFANIGFIGIPIAQLVLGEEGLRLVLMLLSFHSIVLLPTTSFLVARDRGVQGAGGMLSATFDLLKQNPVMIALISALIWAASGLGMPVLIDRILALPATSAAPVGLFATGVALAMVKLDGDLWQAATASAVKLLLVPVAAWIMLRHVFDLPDLWVQAGTLLASLPVGMIAYNLAVQMKVAPRRAASSVLISTLGSIVTLSVLLALIRQNML